MAIRMGVRMQPDCRYITAGDGTIAYVTFTGESSGGAAYSYILAEQEEASAGTILLFR